MPNANAPTNEKEALKNTWTLFAKNSVNRSRVNTKADSLYVSFSYENLRHPEKDSLLELSDDISLKNPPIHDVPIVEGWESD